MTMLESVSKYYDIGWNLIPFIAKDRCPFEWKKYQSGRATKEETLGWFQSHPEWNIGLICGDLFAVDIDSREGLDNINNILGSNILDLETPIQKTPSGGWHVLTKSAGMPNTVGGIRGVDTRGKGGLILLSPSRNKSKIDGQMKEYSWVKSPFDYEVLTLPEPLGTKFRAAPPALVSFNVDEGIPKGMRDDTLFHAAYCLMQGGATKEEVFRYLQLINKSCIPPLSEHVLAQKVNSASNRIGTAVTSIAEDVTKYINESVGEFTIREIYDIFNLRRESEQKIAREVVDLFRDRNIITKNGRKNAIYVKADVMEMREEDYTICNEDPIEINLPLGLSEVALVYPKAMIGFAGTSNVGKTSILMDCAFRNRHLFPEIRYFSSEISKQSFHSRVMNFGYPLEDWSNIKFYRGIDNIDKLLLPDGLNIIDYVETDEAAAVGAYLRSIHRRLDNGVIIYGQQLKEGQTYGVGGHFSVHKACIYTTLEFMGDECLAVVRKIKSPALDGVNMKGLRCSYSITRRGTLIVTRQNEWLTKFGEMGGWNVARQGS